MTTRKTASRSEGDRMSAICHGIRRAIIEGALFPGDRLPEDALGESFGVSRTIARHALGQLAAEGLVDLRRNRIATVAAPTPADARDPTIPDADVANRVIKAGIQQQQVEWGGHDLAFLCRCV